MNKVAPQFEIALGPDTESDEPSYVEQHKAILNDALDIITKTPGKAVEIDCIKDSQDEIDHLIALFITLDDNNPSLNFYWQCIRDNTAFLLWIDNDNIDNKPIISNPPERQTAAYESQIRAAQRQATLATGSFTDDFSQVP